MSTAGMAVRGDPREAGNAGAPAVFMRASPMVGDTFKPEALLPIVNETVTVKKVGLRMQAPPAASTTPSRSWRSRPARLAARDEVVRSWRRCREGKTRGESFALVAPRAPDRSCRASRSLGRVYSNSALLES